jgi:methionyl-tRNA synthetase
MLGKDTFFQTGTDEHGQKIANTAARLGVTPLQLCDVYSEAFQALNQRLLISNDHFVRTNHAYHLKHAQDLWQLCANAGDIYLGKYEGWYNEREEAFVSNQEAEKNDFKDPVSGKELTRTEEESYFFRMSRYQQALIEHMETNPSFVQPESIRSHILSRLRSDNLEDLSISRTSFEWGIPVPEGFDPRHVMYVWFDALSNYASGVFLLENEVGEGVSEEELSRKKYWPASKHMIGKDIAWFHTVIWPCMLLSAGLPLPEQIYSHGFVSDSLGRKMSKSLGNVVDPHDALDKFPAESLRYYLVADAVFGGDLNFSIENFVDRHNAELHDTLGNLSHRIFSLSAKYCGAAVPEANPNLNIPNPFDIDLLRQNIEGNLDTLALHELVARTWDIIRSTNQWLTEQEPWKKTRTDEEKVEIVRLGLEAMYIIGHVIAPVLPVTADKILRLHFPATTPIQTLQDLLSDSAFRWLAPGTPTTVGSVLFAKVTEEGVIAADEEEKKREEEKERKKKLAEENRKKKKQKQEKSQAKPLNIWEAVELRVGVIEEVAEVADSDKLFVE